ncbi:hypothetical protein, partial [Acetoanaerobium noterae]|uniref:hypothetical protein n=1 Tax=Acetoanaerobium noterae TaxID=745369 RepID=UPI0032213A05
DLFEILEKKAEARNVTVNVFVNSTLEGIYKQAPFDYSFALSKLIEEAQQKPEGEEFILAELPSFSEICVVKAKDAHIQPSIIRARLGRLFNSAVKTEKAVGIKRQTIIKDGVEKLKFISKSAVYINEKENA